MERRKFLQNTGVLVPAMLLVSPSILANEEGKATQASLLLIAGSNASNVSRVSELARSAAKSTQQLAGDSVRKIAYSKNGFVVVTNDGQSFRAPKLVFHSSFSVDTERKNVSIDTDSDQLQVQYNSGRSKTIARPEMWSCCAQKLDEQQMKSFLKRGVNGFMCVS